MNHSTRAQGDQLACQMCGTDPGATVGTEENAALSSLVNIVSDAILIADEKGRIIYCNPGALAMFGYSRDAIMGQPLEVALPSDGSGDQRIWVERFRQICQPSRSSGTIELFARKANGTRFPIDLSLSRWQDGEHDHFGIIIRDASDRHLAQTMEDDRRKALDMIAASGELGVTMNHLARMVEHQTPGAVAAILVLRGGQVLQCGPSLPAELCAALGCGTVRLAAALRQASTDAQGHVSGEINPQSPFGERSEAARRCGLDGFHSVPILDRDDQPSGVIVVFLPGGQGLTIPQCIAIEQVARIAMIAIEQTQLIDRLTHQVYHDPLTGLCNRSTFTQKLHHAIEEARLNTREVALLYIDVDHFKRINDTLGHHAGDELICKLAHRFRETLGAAGILARLGGDEFAVVLPNLTDTGTAVTHAKQLLDVARHPLVIGGQEVVVTVTVGMGIFPRDGIDAQLLQKHADIAMYRAKQQGRDRLECFAAEMNQVVAQRLELESDLRRALSNNELELFYQPQFDGFDRIVGAEALARWRHPTRGMISPGIFIPLAEESGQIVTLGDWVMRQACRQQRQWCDARLPRIKVAINVSAAQFSQSDLLRVMRDSLLESAIDPRSIEIEITENLLMDNVGKAAKVVNEIRRHGITAAMDDFGTGYSSMALLQKLPIDVLKIHQDFVRDLGQAGNPATGAHTVIRAIIELSHGLGLRVVAEGVETPYQREFLKNCGCDVFQGFLLAKPQPAGELEALLRTHAMDYRHPLEIRRSA